MSYPFLENSLQQLAQAKWVLFSQIREEKAKIEGFGTFLKSPLFSDFEQKRNFQCNKAAPPPRMYTQRDAKK